jgi:hypothetical protein
MMVMWHMIKKVTISEHKPIQRKQPTKNYSFLFALQERLMHLYREKEKGTEKSSDQTGHGIQHATKTIVIDTHIQTWVPINDSRSVFLVGVEGVCGVAGPSPSVCFPPEQSAYAGTTQTECASGHCSVATHRTSETVPEVHPGGLSSSRNLF